MRNFSIRTETLALLASVFFTVACNGAFLAALMSHRPLPFFEQVWLVTVTAILITGFQWLLLLLIINRWTAKPMLILLAFVTAPAVYYMTTYGIYIDRSMVQNVLETDWREATELFDWHLGLYFVIYGVIPAFLVWKVKIRRGTLLEAAKARTVGIVAAVALVGLGLWPAMDSLIPMMREHREARYLVTPSNVVVSTLRQGMGNQNTDENRPKTKVATDAVRVVHTTHQKPKAFVLVIGETVRARNWGLNGYERQTTPELANLSVVNFKDVASCGTDTATSLPCMLSMYGIRQYDEKKIRDSESILHVLNRVGVEVNWRDNQSGCKGTCSGLPFTDLSTTKDPEICPGPRCYDAVLLKDLKREIDTAKGDVLIVLHMLGTHGPAYYQRYPESFRKFTPTCDTTDLSRCQYQSLVNTYDNGVLYTDFVLSKVVSELKGIVSHETGMLYVSDHGESLGEGNLYLHGLPYALAPKEQTRVPLVM
jgi:lipid A ethanolaminephosphotransferase